MNRWMLAGLLVLGGACARPADADGGSSASLGSAATTGTSDGGSSDGDSGSETAGAGTSSAQTDDGAASTDDTGSETGGVDPGTWEPPIGIPMPEFGVLERAEDCVGCSVVSAPDPQALEDLPPGTIVELEGGPFSGGALTISGEGTPQAPIFVRSKDPDAPVVLSYDVTITGSYLIVEHIDFDQALRDQSLTVSGDHLAIRHSEVHAFRPGHFSTALFVGNAAHVVLLDNEIHDNGDFNVQGEHDVHGVGASNVDRLWIVDSHLHHNRGDSMQFGHQAGNTLGNIFIGRNHMHDDGENCVDIKEASNVVVSENDLHDPQAGVAVVFHDCPVNAAAIYNHIHDTEVGISSASLEDACAAFEPVQIFATRNEFAQAGVAVEGWGTGKRYLVAGNTFAGVPSPISVDNEGPGSVLATDEAGIDVVFGAFEEVYGLDISNP